MKRYITMAVICGCLLVGSLYPRLLLERHVKLVDQSGNELTVEGEYEEDIPLKIQFRILEFF